MGIKKTLLYVGGLILATGGPITLLSTSDLAGGIKRSWFANSSATAAATAPPRTSAFSSNPSALAGTALGSSAAADLLPPPSLPEVLRFDATVEWVMQRWPRVSTGLPYLQLQGYRVSLVTGASLADLAGSLTYYFNAQQQVQRITFRGATGDPRALVSLLAGRYHFTRRLTNDPGVVLYEAVDSSNRPFGSVKIRSASVIKANQPYTRFEIDLAMDRPE